jgi:hypothetical protein
MLPAVWKGHQLSINITRLDGQFDSIVGHHVLGTGI